MTAAYASIANTGKYTKPVFYSQVIDSNGRIILDNTTPNTKTILKDSTAYLLTQAMISVVKEGTGTPCQLANGMPSAGKTGTTSSAYDLWFCGYTPYLTASIWTGYDENTALTGSQNYHEKIWAKVMNQINEVKKYKAKDFATGESVKKYTICDSSGKVAIKGVCPKTHKEYFVKGSEPDKCSWHSAYNNNYDTKEDSTTKAGNAETEKETDKDTFSKKKSPKDKEDGDDNGSPATAKPGED